MKQLFICTLLVSVLVVVGCSKDKKSDTPEKVTINVYMSEGGEKDFGIAQVEKFNASQDRIHVGIVLGSPSVTDQYAVYLQTFEAKKDTLDVIPIDTIWPGDFAEHLVDLNTLGAKKIADTMFKGLVDNNTLDGKLLALPTFNTAGLLLYRTDLLKKYGYTEPPKTWDELQKMAQVIQDGERKTNQDFWGYVWQGASYEGLVCDFLEWTYSNGDDMWINSDRKVTINNPKTQEILEQAKGWIGTISPQGVLSYKEEESRAVFQAGNAAFMRNWFYAYGLGNSDDSVIKGKIDFTSVPAGDTGHGAATTGAWSIGISKYSKHPKEAFEFIKYLVSKKEIIEAAEKFARFPPYVAYYKDKSITDKIPAMINLQAVFENSIARPSTITAPNYNVVSTTIASYVHDMLSGTKAIDTGLEELAFEIEDITGFPAQ